MQRAKATAIVAISALVAVASLYQVFLLFWTGEIFSWFFFHRGHYISFADEPLTAIIQVPLYLFFVALGSYGAVKPLSDE
jgi:hypothetical protein